MSDSDEKPLALRLKEALGDDYTIEGEIGRGGMGVVFRARDERLQRRVAIKVLPPELAFQKEIRERFTREAQTAARLSHPHIVPIHDVGEGKGLVYFIMGLVEGESLGGRLKRRGKLPPEEARRIMKETADALSAAHALSIIHRDIKPDNILLEGTRGRVMVTDFGIAKAVSAGTGHTLTGAGIAIGTPQFMSPEQAAGEKSIDGRSDIYSLGVVTYQMLTGDLPFSAPTVAGILMKQITEPAPVIHERRSDVPEDLSLAVARCLEKDPEGRWPTADALRRSLENRTVGTYRPTTRTEAATRPRAGTVDRMGTGRSASSTRPRTASSRPARAGGALEPLRPRAPAARPSRSPRWVRNERGEWVRASEAAESGILRDTGEPAIVQKVRAQFARWAAVSLGCFALNVATGIDSPWFLFPAAGMGIGLLTNYAKLWQSGYSWRDVLNRPPAADAIQAPGGAKGTKALPPPRREEFGAHYSSVLQVHTDRAAIITLMAKLSPTDKEMLPEVLETADALHEKALEMARTLHSMDSNLNREGLERIEERLAELQAEPPSDERERRLVLLAQQKKAYQDLIGRRGQVADRLESSVLAMQNMRFDLLRLRSAGVGAVINDLSQATMQARALSRDVDNAIAAASEVREALG
ncbi:MAG: protein kinase [Gemmatimonadota bacterium]|jgi:serine/threonine protein kinase|nr:protein kinase [Gemmatimonadota bacterium]